MDNQMKLNVDLSKNSTPVKCQNEGCEAETFREVVYIRRVSKLITGAPNDSYLPIPVFQCSVCSHINKEFIPKI
jgi:hypothetical protein